MIKQLTFLLLSPSRYRAQEHPINPPACPIRLEAVMLTQKAKIQNSTCLLKVERKIPFAGVFSIETVQAFEEQDVPTKKGKSH